MGRKISSVLSFLFLVSVSFLAGCATHQGFNPSTGVGLNQQNFEVVGTVEGRSECTQFLKIGQCDGMFNRARKKAMGKAGIIDGDGKAITNWTSDVEVTWVGPVRNKQVIVSGEIVQFTE